MLSLFVYLGMFIPADCIRVFLSSFPGQSDCPLFLPFVPPGRRFPSVHFPGILCRLLCSFLSGELYSPLLVWARGVVCFKYFYYLCSRFNIKVWNKAGRGLGYNPVAYVLPPHILHLKLDSSLGYMRPRMCNDSTQMYKDVKP